MNASHPDSVPSSLPPSHDLVESDFQPAARSVLVIAFGPFVFASLVLFACWAAVAMGKWTDHQGLLLLAPILLVLLVLAIAAIIRNSRQYQLSRHRVRAAGGVLARFAVEARLEDIRSVVVTRSVPQRLLGLGSIELSTAGIGPAILWRDVARPADRAEEVRRAIDASRVNGGARVEGANAPIASHAPSRPIHTPVIPIPSQSGAVPRRLPVIGLAGGIGAGKSTVAKSFERHGCFVIDSDARARAALDRPDVRDTLVRWWGDSILAPDGRADRSKIAAIVFADPEQRARLERLVHPIVREDRAAMIREALAAGARAAIVDAPLLFEAGVDAECDCVVFVDAPHEQRLDRVRQTRAWDEAELNRREASQLPLDDKRRRSRHIVDNSGKLGGIDTQIARILALIEAGG